MHKLEQMIKKGIILYAFKRTGLTFTFIMLIMKLNLSVFTTIYGLAVSSIDNTLLPGLVYYKKMCTSAILSW